jgi:predicted transposase YbfD/YdcC
LQHLADDFVEQKEWGHGRAEVRRCYVLAATAQDWPQARRQWPGLQSIIAVESRRQRQSSSPSNSSTQWRFYLSSLKPEAAGLLTAVRAHWQVENNVHWCLDVAFDEDGSRARKDHSAENLAVLRRLALNLLRQDNLAKSGLKARRLHAGWNNDYLLRILCSANA